MGNVSFSSRIGTADQPFSNPAWERAVQEFLVDGDYRLAAVRSELPIDPLEFYRREAVVARIAWLQEQRASDLQVRRQAVLDELSMIVHSSITDYDIDPEAATVTVKPGLPPERVRAIAKAKITKRVSLVTKEVTVSIELALWDKNAGIEKMMRHLGMLTEAGQSETRPLLLVK